MIGHLGPQTAAVCLDDGPADGPVSYTHLDVYKRQALARACMAGEASPPAMRARAERVLGHPAPWLVPLALHLHFECAPPAGEVWHPRQHDQVVAAILAFPAFLAAFEQPEGCLLYTSRCV